MISMFVNDFLFSLLFAIFNIVPVYINNEQTGNNEQ